MFHAGDAITVKGKRSEKGKRLVDTSHDGYFAGIRPDGKIILFLFIDNEDPNKGAKRHVFQADRLGSIQPRTEKPQ